MSQAGVQFEIGQVLGRSWEIFKANLGPLLGGFLVMFVIIGASSAVYIGPIILSGPMTLGFYKMARTAVNGQSVEFSDLFSGFQKFLPAFLAYLIIAIFTSIGMIFCILPGILVSLVYMPTYLFILDDNLDFWNAMEASRKMVMNNFGQWLLLLVVLFALNLVGMLACCVGFVVTAPVSILAITLAYDMERRAARGAVEMPPLPPSA